ncbi:MAG TPA: ankyrin repeat domain-containing protein [Armatimonadota bacterium]|jgi:ankyrin repeat protein
MNDQHDDEPERSNGQLSSSEITMLSPAPSPKTKTHRIWRKIVGGIFLVILAVIAVRVILVTVPPIRRLINPTVGDLRTAFFRDDVRPFIAEIHRHPSMPHHRSAETGYTFLHNAARQGKPNIARLFIERGADVTARNNDGDTPIALAVMASQPAIVYCLLEHGVNINTPCNKPRLTPLQLAASQGLPEMSTLLLSRGAHVDQGNASLAEAPTQLAMKCALMRLANYPHRSPAWKKQCARPFVDTLTILLDHGAKPNMRDFQGETLLHIAVMDGQCDMVKVLLKHKAPIDATDVSHETPLMLAKRYHRDEILNVLCGAGAKQ